MASEKKAFKKILLQAAGSRGDCQPMMAIALKLQDEGYDVTFLTNTNQVASFEGFGGKAVGCFLDMEVAMGTGKLAASQQQGDVDNFVAGMADANKEHAPWMVKLWYETISELKPDLVISGTLCYFLSMFIQRHFRIPIVNISLQPIPVCPPRMVFGLPNVPCCGLNKFIINILTGGVAQGEIDSFGVELKKQYGIDWTKLFTKQEVMNCINNPPPAGLLLSGSDPFMSELLYGGRQNIPRGIKTLGFFAIESDRQLGIAKQNKLQKQKSKQFGGQEDLEELETFLANGAPPAFIGFGSMVARSPEYMVVLLSQAVKNAQTRGILGRGWAKLSQDLLEKSTKDTALIEYARKNILFAGNTSHEWLFPQCSCIVHHGGAGTTCTAIRSGVPQIVIPVWLDQWDMARTVTTYGSGIGFTKQLLKVEAPEIANAIKKVQADEQIKAKAKVWSAEAKARGSVNRAVEEVRFWWDQQVATGLWDKYIEEQVKALKK